MKHINGPTIRENLSDVEELIEKYGKEPATAEVEKTVEPPESVQERKTRQAQIMASPEFHTAVNVVHDVFNQFIVFEIDAPKEARIMLFPAFMHITREAVNAEIISLYGVKPPQVGVAPGGLLQMEYLEDIRLIQDGISDAISILKLRTEGAFPAPGTRALKDYEYTSLSDLAWIEAALFYRITEKDKTVGFIDVSTMHKIRANATVNSRFRSWIAVDKFAVLFVDVLSNPDVEDMVMALMDKDAEINAGYAQYLLRWREGELI